MNFRKTAFREEPEINLVPFIDVLLVIVIFMAVTTTYAKFSELKINLPVASAEEKKNAVNEIIVGLSSEGTYLINGQVVSFTTPLNFAALMQKSAKGLAQPSIIINADGNASHQSVVNIMEASRLAGYSKIVFTTQFK